MCFNYDHHFMFSCGEDGNIFSYHVNFEEETDYIIPSRERIASPGIVSPNDFLATKYHIRRVGGGLKLTTSTNIPTLHSSVCEECRHACLPFIAIYSI
jgi:hypothetical protein